MQIPEGWEEKKFVKFSSKMQSGGTPKSDNPNFYNGNIPFVAIDDLTSTNKYLYKTKKKITNQGLANSATWEVPVNSLMYSIYATLGVPRINKIVAATNQAILNIIPDENVIDLEFLYYLLLEKRTTILAHSAHTTQSNLNAKIVKELEFIFPKSLTEQKKIAQILSTVDKTIEQTGQLIAKYERIKTGLMQDLLTKGIDENGNIRSEETHEFKESELGRIPVEWEVEKISDLCKLIVDCKNRTSPFVVKSQYPVIRTSNIKDGKLIWTDMKYTDKKSYIIWTDRAIPTADDVIITREAPLGQVLKIPNGITPVLGQRTMLFRVDEKELLPDYLVNSILTENMQLHLNSLSGGSTVHHLKVGQMKEFNIAIPKNIKEQKRILRLLMTTEKEIDVFAIQLQKLHRLKTALMQDLLSGKKRVNSIINYE